MFEDLHGPESSLLAPAGIDLMWESSEPAHSSTSFLGRGVCFPFQSPAERTYCHYGCCLLWSWNILCLPEILLEKFSGQLSKASAPDICESAHRVLLCPILSLPREPEQVPLHPVLEMTKKNTDLWLISHQRCLCTCPPWTNCIFCMNISVTWFFPQQNPCLCQCSNYVNVLRNIQLSSLFMCACASTSTQTCHKRIDSVLTLVSSL